MAASWTITYSKKLQYMLSLKTHWSNLQKWRKKRRRGVFKMQNTNSFQWSVQLIFNSTTKKFNNATIRQQLVIFNQWIAGKQLFQIAIVCDHGRIFIGQLDSQQSFVTQSFADPKRRNVTSASQLFAFKSLSCSTSKNFH